MPQVTYRPASGEPITVDAFTDMTLMEVALCNDIPGIVGLCGGICSCATCHVYVDEAFTDRVGGAGDLEDDMLDGAAAERLPNSRLSCQIKMRDELDGLLVRIAPEQL